MYKTTDKHFIRIFALKEKYKLEQEMFFYTTTA